MYRRLLFSIIRKSKSTKRGIIKNILWKSHSWILIEVEQKYSEIKEVLDNLEKTGSRLDFNLFISFIGSYQSNIY